MEVSSREDLNGMKQRHVTHTCLNALLKWKAGFIMKWEALALAVLTQTLQVGLRPKLEPSLCPTSPLPADVRSESHCHCSCFCGGIDLWSGAAFIGFALGGLISSLLWCCCGGRSAPSASSPRIRGHGVVTQPIAWPDLGRLLRGWHLLAWAVAGVET